MRILYITTNLFQRSNSAAIRNTALIKGLLSNDTSITILTVDVRAEMKGNSIVTNFDKCKILSYDLGLERYQRLGNKSNTKSTLINNVIKKLKTIVKDYFFFPDNYKGFIKAVMNDDHSNYDLIISSSDLKSSHFAALEIVKKYGYQGKWIQIWGDPWHRDINLKKNMVGFVKKKEYKMLKEADHIVYVSEPTLRLCVADFPDLASKMSYIPRSFFKEVIVDRNLSKESVSILYTGILGDNRDIYTFLNSIDEKIFNLRMYGNYSNEELKKLCKYKNVKTFESVDYECVLEEISKSDVLLYLGNKGEGSQIPGKLFDYLGSNLPIVCLVYDKEDEVSVFLKSLKNVFLVSYEEIERNEGISENMIKFIKSSFQIDETYSPKNIANKILKLL
ncbi:MAG: hypothetical protein LBI73_13770 [Myroides sp.]|jgi:hypothetical protein|nr:hypothetical protein [Myroides sp.]